MSFSGYRPKFIRSAVSRRSRRKHDHDCLNIPGSLQGRDIIPKNSIILDPDIPIISIQKYDDFQKIIGTIFKQEQDGNIIISSLRVDSEYVTDDEFKYLSKNSKEDLEKDDLNNIALNRIKKKFENIKPQDPSNFIYIGNDNLYGIYNLTYQNEQKEFVIKRYDSSEDMCSKLSEPIENLEMYIVNIDKYTFQDGEIKVDPSDETDDVHIGTKYKYKEQNINGITSCTFEEYFPTQYEMIRIIDIRKDESQETSQETSQKTSQETSNSTELFEFTIYEGKNGITHKIINDTQRTLKIFLEQEQQQEQEQDEDEDKCKDEGEGEGDNRRYIQIQPNYHATLFYSDRWRI